MGLSISKAKKRALDKKMRSLKIYEEDLDEKFVLSGGRGGQKVDKTSSCVYLKHIPTGIEVKCHRERSQSQNRFTARSILAERIQALIAKRISRNIARIQKLRRQKRGRLKRTKERLLRDKAFRTRKKQARSYRPGPEELGAL